MNNAKKLIKEVFLLSNCKKMFKANQMHFNYFDIIKLENYLLQKLYRRVHCMPLNEYDDFGKCMKKVYRMSQRELEGIYFFRNLKRMAKEKCQWAKEKRRS